MNRYRITPPNEYLLIDLDREPFASLAHDVPSDPVIYREFTQIGPVREIEIALPCRIRFDNVVSAFEIRFDRPVVLQFDKSDKVISITEEEGDDDNCNA